MLDIKHSEPSIQPKLALKHNAARNIHHYIHVILFCDKDVNNQPQEASTQLVQDSGKVHEEQKV